MKPTGRKPYATRQGRQQGQMIWIAHCTFCLCLCALPLSEPMIAERAHRGIAQQSDAPRTKVEQALAEADRLQALQTADALTLAIKKYEEAVALFKASGDQVRQARALNAIGRCHTDLGERAKSLEYFRQALALFKAGGDRGGEATALNNLGSAYDALGQKYQALEYYEQALPLFKAAADLNGEAITLNNLGAVYKSLGDKKALDYYERALVLMRQTKDRAGEAGTLNNLGALYSARNKPDRALGVYQQALGLWRAAGDRRGEAGTMVNLGQLYAQSGDKQQALDHYNQALPLWRMAGDRGGEDRTLSLLRQLELAEGGRDPLPGQLRQYEKQIGRARTSGDRRGEAGSLEQIGNLLVSAGKFQRAIPYVQQSLPLWRSLGDRAAEERALFQLSHCYAALGRRPDARDYLQQILALWRAGRNRQGEARALRQIARNYDAAGEKQAALDATLQSLALWRTLGNRVEEAATLQFAGSVYRDFGERQKALDTFGQALRLYQAEGARAGEAETLAQFGTVLAALGEQQPALDYYRQALAIFRGSKSTSGEPRTLQLMGRAEADLGEHQKALDHYNLALPLWRALKDRSEEARALSDIGTAYAALGQPQQALDNQAQALRLLRIERNRAGEAIALHRVGAAYAALGQSQTALDHYSQAYLLFRAMNDWSGAAAALYGLARGERDRGNLIQARRQIEAALRAVESLRTKVVNRQLRASYFASVQDYYEFYIDLLMRLHPLDSKAGHAAAGLEASELARARNLLELLTEARADIRQGVDARLLERERAAQQLLNDKAAAQLQLLNREHSEEQAAALDREIQELTAECQAIAAQIRGSSPRYAALTQPQPLSIKAIQEQVLDAGTLLLEYSLGEERSYLWAVTPTTVTSHTLPQRAGVEAAAQRVYALFSAANRSQAGETAEQKASRLRLVREQYLAAASDLSRMLLGQVADQLGKKRLVIVADGMLHYIPFGALPDPNSSTGGNEGWQPLAVEHEVVNLPSVSTLAVLRRELQGRQPAARTLAVLADPVFAKDDSRVKPGAPRLESPPASPAPNSVNDSITRKLVQTSAGAPGELRIPRLPYTRLEAEQILSLVTAGSGIKALDFEASRATVMSERLGQYRYVHFATHGLADSERPELSTIVLSLFDEQGKPQDGFLRAHEVYNLNLPAEMVVLSACETGLGKLTRGEGLVSLTRGFMYAGAARVVVSLWSVNDKATAELMTKFYRKILVEGQRPAAALRAAQVEMWRTKQWEAPYYWAAFMLQGEWR